MPDKLQAPKTHIDIHIIHMLRQWENNIWDDRVGFFTPDQEQKKLTDFVTDLQLVYRIPHYPINTTMITIVVGNYEEAHSRARRTEKPGVN